MKRAHVLLSCATASLLTLLSPMTARADYPTRPIELVVPSSPGGGTDAMGRIFADSAKKFTTQPLIVTNRPGASGAIGMGEVLRAPADGYKISVVISELATIPGMKLAKYTSADFIPLAGLNADPALITVRADAPWNTIEEFIAHARQKPEGVSMGNSGHGSIWHLTAAAVEEKIGAKFSHVPFQGSAPSVLALLGGHVDAIVVSPAEIGPYVSSGKLKPLVVMTEKRLPGALFEKVPTFKERKVDLTLGTWRGLAVAKGTPPEVVKYLREVARKTAADPGFIESMHKANLSPLYTEPQAFGTYMATQTEFFTGLLSRVKVDK